MVSSLWEERIASATILSLILQSVSKNECEEIQWTKESIHLNEMSAQYIRKKQKWLTSDRSVRPSELIIM